MVEVNELIEICNKKERQRKERALYLEKFKSKSLLERVILSWIIILMMLCFMLFYMVKLILVDGPITVVESIAKSD